MTEQIAQQLSILKTQNTKTKKQKERKKQNKKCISQNIIKVELDIKKNLC